MTNPAKTEAAPDPWVLRFRERVTAVIAGTIVAGTIFLITAAAWLASSNEAYARVKDLLLFVNPLVGYVIGYYFTKTTTEARAESAEATAKAATLSAQQAVQAQSQAESRAEDAQSKAQTAQAQAHEARVTLSELAVATEQYVAQTQPAHAPAVLGGPGADTAAAEPPGAALHAVLERARRVLAQ
jgi:hypothetical protein